MPSYGQAKTDSATRQLQARTDGRTNGRTTHLEKNPLVPERTGEIDSIRILTVRQPWAWAIIRGGKDVENRVRNIAGSYRGPVAIHAGLAYDVDAVIMPAPLYAPIPVDEDGSHLRPAGAIIGVVDLVDVHTAGDCYHASIERAADLFRTDRAEFNRLPITNPAGGLLGRAALCSAWAEGNETHHLALKNPRPLAEPIPFKGALGLRTLPADVAAQVWAGVA